MNCACQLISGDISFEDSLNPHDFFKEADIIMRLGKVHIHRLLVAQWRGNCKVKALKVIELLVWVLYKFVCLEVFEVKPWNRPLNRCIVKPTFRRSSLQTLFLR